MINSYSLFTLDALRMANSCDIKNDKTHTSNHYMAVYRYDLSSRHSADYNIVLNYESQQDNALFYQILQCLKVTKVHSSDKDTGALFEKTDALKHSIVFVDFKQVFQKDDDINSSPYELIDDVEVSPEAIPKEDKSMGKTEEISNNSSDVVCVELDDKTPEQMSFDELKKSVFGRVYWMFEPISGGIFLKFTEPGGYKKFVPFDKSQSQTKKYRMTFIDVDLKDTLERRLLLGIDFSHISVNPSKYYAYRGLYLSSGFRIDQTDQFELNHESVIVISGEDDRNEVEATTFTVTKPETVEVKYKEELTCDEKENCSLTINSFDGEGLISPPYAKLIDSVLREKYGFKKSSHSFQIRLPFIKGMLHEVDFHLFFQKELQIDESDSVYIKDVFGIRRDLRKAKIILTKSMFKCFHWIKSYWNKHKDLCNDPMIYFFSTMKDENYQHTLYVTNSDGRLNNQGIVRLNHQFLSTLDLNYEEFESILEGHTHNIDRIPYFLARYGKAFSFEDQDDERYTIEEKKQDVSDGEKTINIREKCVKAFEKNIAFLNERKVKDLIRDLQKTAAKNICLGKLTVEGEQRYLARDLLELLVYISKRIELNRDSNHNAELTEKQKMINEKCKEVEKKRIPDGLFYMPKKIINLNASSYYGVLRNPHLSRNEQCALQPYVQGNDIYEEYFSKLNGIVMVSYRSLAPMALSGADFDGDLVKIISNKAVVEAIRRSVYKEEKRILPVINIPGISPNKQQVAEINLFQVVKDTFSNQVGHISNIAVRLAKREYNAHTDATYKNSCAVCTIVTGLEIDAAKTGFRPTANIRALESLDTKRDFFLGTKKIVSEIDMRYKTPYVTTDHLTLRDSEKTRNIFSLHMSRRIRRPYIKAIEYTKEYKQPIINLLPGTYLKYLYEKQVAHQENVVTETDQLLDMIPKKKVYFKFQNDINWVPDMGLQQEVLDIVKAYLNVRSINWRVESTKRASAHNHPYKGHIITSLKIQYDSLEQILPGSKACSVKNALEQAYAIMEGNIIKDAYTARQALKRMMNANWHFTLPEQRRGKVEFILGCNLENNESNKDMINLLSNFNNNGFKIFYYLLWDVQSYFNNEITPMIIERINQQNILENRVIEILDMQYGNRNYRIDSTGESIDMALRKTYFVLWSALNSMEKATVAINRMMEIQWQFIQGDEKRLEAIAYILGVKKEEISNKKSMIYLLSNFRNEGSMLFYSILKDIQASYCPVDSGMDTAEETDVTSTFLSESSSCFDELYDTYIDAVQGSRNWNVEIVDKCRLKLKNLFRSNMDEAMKYVYYIPSKVDPTHNFLWNVFTENEILRNVFFQQFSAVRKGDNQ